LGAAGNFVWAKAISGTGPTAGLGIALGADQSVYTTGYFGGTVDFDPGGGVANLTSAGRMLLPNVFVSKLNAAGDFVWARAMGGKDGAVGDGIAVAADGSVVTTGSFEKTADFDPGPGTLQLTSIGSADIFVSKLASAAANLALTPWTVPESRPLDTLAGAFSTPDFGTGETFTYALSAGAGDNDNGAFRIVGDQLLTATVLDYETQATHSIRVRMTDAHGAWYERALQVAVLNAAPTVTIRLAADQEAPTNHQPIYLTVVFSEPVVGFSAEDVVLSGTAPGAQVEDVNGDGVTYRVRIAGLTDFGTVIASIPASAVQDGGGAPNEPSTSPNAETVFLPWTNVVSPWDMDASGRVTAQDALILINEINRGNSGKLPGLRPPTAQYFFDVSPDGQLTPQDVLSVINYINSHPTAAASAGVTPNAAAGESLGLAATSNMESRRDAETRGWAPEFDVPAARPRRDQVRDGETPAAGRAEIAERFRWDKEPSPMRSGDDSWRIAASEKDLGGEQATRAKTIWDRAANTRSAARMELDDLGLVSGGAFEFEDTLSEIVPDIATVWWRG
jgi:hypothetical protein